MRYGVCAGADKLGSVKLSGAAYIECSVTGICAMGDVELSAFVKSLEQNNLSCEALNVLFPGDISLFCDDLSDIRGYLSRSFSKLAPLNPENVVFGSGKARFRPEGFTEQAAFERLTEVGNVIAQEAEKFGITIALEPLNRSETNTINSLAEGAALVRAVGHPNFQLLADIYHMLVENEPAQELYKCKGLLVHTHIAMRDGRTCPKSADRETLVPYFTALGEIGYTGRMSVEGNLVNMETELPEAFSLFKTL